MNHGSLFSGIGGFDLAAEWMGWNNIFHCEWMPFPQKVLKHYWPNAISYNDITKTDFTIHRGTIDILTGGFPCQPYSLAGKRKGKEDERHLWPEMLRAIREIQPRWIVGENVRGIINWSEGLVFEEVCSDLENAGYEVMPVILPACGVNAPHRRDRIWFIAYSNNKGGSTRFKEVQRTDGEISKWNNDAQSCNSSNENASDTTCFRRNENDWRGNGESNVTNEISKTGNASDTCNERLQRSEDNRSTESIRKKSYKHFAGCLRTNWENFPTQSPICGGDDGIPDRLDGITFPKWRNESIKGYGNAIVPQVAFQIFKTIEQYNELNGKTHNSTLSTNNNA